MHLLDLLSISSKNVFRAGIRAILCMLSVCIGITSICAVLGMGNTASYVVQKELDHLGICGVAFYDKNGNAVSNEAVQVLAQTPGVTAVMPLALTTGTVTLRTTRANAGLLGIDETLDQVFRLEVLHGTLPLAQQVRAGEHIIVVDEELAMKTYQRTNIVGKSLTVTLNGVHETMEICAVIRSQSKSLSALLGSQLPYLVYLPYTTMKELSNTVVPDKVIAAISEDQQETIANHALSVLNRKFNNKFKYENLNQYLDSFSAITQAITVLISGIAAISIVVGGIGVMNAMVSAVDARTQEIGIYRALGAKKRDIIRTFMTESLILCVIGGISGILCSLTLFISLSKILDYKLIFQWKVASYSLIIAILCGVIFGFLPAIRAAKLDPIQAIRSE